MPTETTTHPVPLHDAEPREEAASGQTEKREAALACRHVVERDGSLVAFPTPWGTVDLVDLAPADSLLVPWTEPCDGCSDLRSTGNGRISAGQFGEAGVCDSCWGSGRVLFAFAADDSMCAHFVPPVVAQPWIAGHRAPAVVA